MKNKTKKMYVFLMCFILAGLRVGVGYADELKLLAHWRLDEGTGNVVHDSSGNGFDGTILNEMRGVEWVNGRDGKALKFSGTRDGNKSGCVSAPKLKGDFNRGMTAMAWMKINSESKSTDTYSILGNFRDTKGPGFHLYYNWRKMMFHSGNGTELWGVEVSAPETECFGRWMHVAASYNGKHYKIYLDGNEKAVSEENISFTNNPGYFFVGSSYAGSCYGFQGILDDIRIYSEALLEKDILKLAKVE